MSANVTDMRIINVAKKLGINSKGVPVDRLRGKVLDTIEKLLADPKWKAEHVEIVKFYNECLEEIERMREYEDTFI